MEQTLSETLEDFKEYRDYDDFLDYDEEGYLYDENKFNEGKDLYFNWCLSCNRMFIEHGQGVLDNNFKRFSKAFLRFYNRNKKVIDNFIVDIYRKERKDMYYLYYYYLSVRLTRIKEKSNHYSELNRKKHLRRDSGEEGYGDIESLENMIYDIESIFAKEVNNVDKEDKNYDR